MHNREKWQRTLELHDELAPLIQSYLKRTFRIPEQDVEDMIQAIFFENIFKSLTHPINNYRGLVFKIAKNAALDHLEKLKRLITNYGGQSQGDETDNSPILENIEEALAVAKNMEEALDLQWCVEKGLAKYERDYPQALCPLLVTLSKLERPIEEMAVIIYRTVPNTSKLLKKCQKEAKRYKDYYNEYQEAHGIESLCWLVFYLKSAGWDRKEMGKLLNKTESAIGMTLTRCKQKLMPYLEKCLENCQS